MTPETQMFDNGATRRGKLRLSVLIPFHRHDPSGLLAQLAELGPAIEVVLLDNGSGDQDRTRRLMRTMLSLPLPCRLVQLPARLSPAMARNRLALEARADRRLVVDPATPNASEMLKRTLAMIAREEAATLRPGADRPRARATEPLGVAA